MPLTGVDAGTEREVEEPLMDEVSEAVRLAVAGRVSQPARGFTELADRVAIVDAVRAYALAIDERRWDLLAEVLTEDHQFRGTGPDGRPLDALDGRSALVAWLEDYLGALGAQLRHHFTGVLVTEQGPDDATVLAYLLLTSAAADGVQVVSTAVYRVSLVRVDGAWRISRLDAAFDGAPREAKERP